jgi:hypothetical protein
MPLLAYFCIQGLDIRPTHYILCYVQPDTQALARYSPPSEQARSFMEHLTVGCLSPLEAAEAAGYPNPPDALRRLLQDPKLVKALIVRFQAESVPWRALVARSKNVLWRELGGEDARTRVDAAKTVLTAMRKNDVTSFADSADAEDRADKAALIRDVLGELESPQPQPGLPASIGTSGSTS